MVLNASLWQTDPVSYLLNDKFPINYMLSIKSSAPNSTLADKGLLQEITNFREFLEKKTRDEIALLVTEARQREAERQRLHDEKVEAEAFFNQPSSNADFTYWSRIAYWTLEEGVALSLGKNPAIVDWDKIKAHRPNSLFVKKYAAKHEEVRRAKAMGQLWDSTIPFVFIKWANRIGFEMPSELISSVVALGPQILDWKTAYEQEVVEKAKIEINLGEANEKTLEMMRDNTSFIEKMNADNNKLIEGYQKSIAQRDQFIAEQKREIALLKTAKPVAAKNQKPEIGQRERDSLLKLILGIAIKGYSYDPKATRSKEVLEITNDLQFLGLSLTEDTVRKYLSEAKGLFADVITEQKG